VEDLENFYYEHDLDERAILFEKQRLKLRKLLSMEIAQADPAGAITYGEEGERPASSAKRKSKGRKGQPQMVHSGSGAKTRVAPIYDWEVRGNQTAKGKEPSSFEFRVKLNPEEYEELMDRRGSAGARGHTFLRKGTGQSIATVKKAPVADEEESPYVTSTGPYIEPQYFENWRYVHKDKWVAKTDFAVSKEAGNFPQNLQLDDFLHNGPYIENAFKACLRSEENNKWVSDNFKRHV